MSPGLAPRRILSTESAAGTGPESHEISPVTAKPTRGAAAQRGIPCARGDVEAGCLEQIQVDFTHSLHA